MYRCVFLCCIHCLLCFSANGQVPEKKYDHRAFHITSENDNYVWPYHDHYFTNGLRIGYSYLLSSSKGKSSIQHSKKTIINFKIGQDIYTPHDIRQSDMRTFDRPYASYLFFRSGVSTFPHRNSNLTFDVDIGWIGPGAGGEQVQSWWHRFIRYTQPQGWKYQISNEPVINFRSTYRQAWSVLSWADLLTFTGVQAGTAFNKLSQGMMARAGKINTIDNSAVTDSKLHDAYPQKDTFQGNVREWFAFYGINTTWVLHNTLIEGSLFYASQSMHTEETVPLLLTQKAGLVYSDWFTTVKLTMYALSSEVVRGKKHQYLSIDLAFRF